MEIKLNRNIKIYISYFLSAPLCLLGAILSHYVLSKYRARSEDKSAAAFAIL